MLLRHCSERTSRTSAGAPSTPLAAAAVSSTPLAASVAAASAAARHRHHNQRRHQQPGGRRRLRPAPLGELRDGHPVCRQPSGFSVRPHPLGPRGRRLLHGCSASRRPLRLPGRRPEDHCETGAWHVPSVPEARGHRYLPPAHSGDHLLAAAFGAAANAATRASKSTTDPAAREPREPRVLGTLNDLGVQDLRLQPRCSFLQCRSDNLTIGLSVLYHRRYRVVQLWHRWHGGPKLRRPDAPPLHLRHGSTGNPPGSAPVASACASVSPAVGAVASDAASPCAAIARGGHGLRPTPHRARVSYHCGELWESLHGEFNHQHATWVLVHSDF